MGFALISPAMKWGPRVASGAICLGVDLGWFFHTWCPPEQTPVGSSCRFSTDIFLIFCICISGVSILVVLLLSLLLVGVLLIFFSFSLCWRAMPTLLILLVAQMWCAAVV